ncbi:MAG: hypothetical protein C0415_01490 [Thermodesulfovibrio sp.]|nr:hypothetical protein [Thermodesulfovibrio sp.]
MNQNILYSAKLKRLLIYYIAVGVLSACVLSGIIILKKYEDSFSDTVKKLQTVKKNFARTGDIIKDMDLSTSAIKVVIPSDFTSKAPEDLIFIGLDDIKSRFGDAEISITNLEYRGEEVSLPVNIKGGMKDYITLVNNCGYLQSMSFPFFSIGSISLSQVQGKGSVSVVYEISGTLKISSRQLPKTPK